MHGRGAVSFTGRRFMPEVTRPANQPGDFLVDYEEKVFPDV